MQPKGADQFSRAAVCKKKLREHASKLTIRWIEVISLSTKLFPS